MARQFKVGDIVKYKGANLNRSPWGRNHQYIPGVVEDPDYYGDVRVHFQNKDTYNCFEYNLILLTEAEIEKYCDDYILSKSNLEQVIPAFEQDIPSIKDLLKNA